MKKLIVAATIICAAAISQAASFNWSTSANLMGPDVDLTNLSAGKVGNGSTAIKVMSDITWSYTMDIVSSYGKTDSLSFTVGTWKGSKPNQALSSDAVFKPGSGEDDNVVNYTIVITGKYTDAKGNDWTITSDKITSQKAYSELSSLDLNTAAASGWTVSGSAIPEPTSGLLLLLGMAGLALKRKCA